MFRAALIGLGKIAWGLGHDGKTGASLSHKSAIDKHPQTRLVCACSPDAEERERFSHETGIPACDDLEAMLEQYQPDLVSICSPTAYHAEHLRCCLQHNVPMIWLEKPAASSLDELQALLQLQQNSTVLVNYQRRYTGSYQQLKKLVTDNRYGKPLAVDIHYSRGLGANGSHMLDMLYFVFEQSVGEPLWVEQGKKLDNPDCVLPLQGGALVHISGIDADYHNIDFIVTCETARLSILHGGMTVRIETRIEHELFPGFYRLQDSQPAELGEPGFDHAFDRALQDLIDAHQQQRQPLSNLHTAAQSQGLLETILTKSRP